MPRKPTILIPIDLHCFLPALIIPNYSRDSRHRRRGFWGSEEHRERVSDFFLAAEEEVNEDPALAEGLGFCRGGAEDFCYDGLACVGMEELLDGRLDLICLDVALYFLA